MKKNICRFSLLFLVGTAFCGCIQGCSTLPQASEAVMSSEEADVLAYPGSEKISVNESDVSKFTANLLGTGYLLFRSSTYFYWTTSGANDVISDLNKRLDKSGWLVERDWEHQNALLLAAWKKSDLELSILLFDDLDSIGIDSLLKNYRISGPVPGSTMLVMHIIDNSTQH